jgi:hypothetical protein
MDCVETMDKKQLIKLVSFFVMGDGSLEQHGKNARISISHNNQNNDYLMWKKEILENITSCSEYLRKRSKESHSYNTIIRSKTNPLYTTLIDRLYLNNHKVIDPHTLKLLDFEALAILIQDDGSCDNRFGRMNSLRIHTNSYSYGDNLLLKKAIKENLDLEFNVVKNKKWYELRLRNKDYIKLYNGCKPYMFESFNYKLPIPTLNSLKKDGEIVQTSMGIEEVDRNDLLLL